MMLTGAQWAPLEPSIEICRPHAKVPPQHLGRTISAILWRHENGAKWRALPDELIYTAALRMFRRLNDEFYRIHGRAGNRLC